MLAKTTSNSPRVKCPKPSFMTTLGTSIHVQSHLSHFSDNVNLLSSDRVYMLLNFPKDTHNPGKIFAKSPFSSQAYVVLFSIIQHMLGSLESRACADVFPRAVLMHHNLCKQLSLTYIYTNGDSTLSMVGSESRIPGF